MKGKNRVIIRGNLTKDPTISVSKTGVKVAWFIIASNFRVKTEDEKWEDRADFIPVICFRNNANFAEKYLIKGSPVEAEGKLKNRAFTDRNGRTFYSLEFVANDLTPLGGKKASDNLVAEEQDYPLSDATEPDISGDEEAMIFDPSMFDEEMMNQMLGAQNPPIYK